MNRKKKWLYISVLSLLVIALITFYVYKEYRRTNRDTSELKPDYVITASSIINDFEADQAMANKKYTDKIILTKGFVKDILKDDRGFYSLLLGDTLSMSSVKCSMDSIHTYEIATMQKGNYAAVKGVCAGFNADELLGSDVILVRCVIDKKQKITF